jgi:putative AbiEi antitoxin of type IV toxin-antitoxin system/uncharacterized protein DUF559
MPEPSHIGSGPRNLDATPLAVEVAELAAGQHGVVATRQLRALGMGKATVSRWVADRRLIPMHRGVHAVGHRSLTVDGHRMAAVLACGPGAVLSHRAAAAVWGLRPDNRTRWDVTVARGGGRHQATFDAHQCRLDPRDRTERSGIPVTTPARTLLDLAEVVPRDHLDRALENAIRLRLHDLHALDDVLARHQGRRGRGPLQRALEEIRPERANTRSELERLALELVDRHALPRPEVNGDAEGHEIDLLWRAERVAVELDSREFHLTPQAFERDRHRDAHLQALGYRTLRFTHRQLTRESGTVTRHLSAVLEASREAATSTP